jgi:hypothetical protein
MRRHVLFLTGLHPLMIIGVILAIVFAVIFFNYPGNDEPIACAADAKICPDGSVVSRNHEKNCEFDECPSIEGKHFCADDVKICSD